jgi:hypothetical protein
MIPATGLTFNCEWDIVDHLMIGGKVKVWQAQRMCPVV